MVIEYNTKSVIFNISSMNSLVPCPKKKEIEEQIEEEEEETEETDMYDLDNTLTTEKEYMIIRVENITRNHQRSLEKHFHLVDHEQPKTYADMKKRIEEGMFTLPSDDTESYYAPSISRLRWRDPARPFHQEGYEKAKENLYKTRTATTDQIMIKTPEEGLKALQEFESATFH